MSSRVRRFVVRCAPTLLAALLAAGCADLYTDWTPGAVAETQLRGARIAAALEAYRRDTLTYPSDLSLLATKYLPEVPPPTAGSRVWKYEVSGGGAAYDLSFGGPGANDASYTYSSDNRSWERQ